MKTIKQALSARKLTTFIYLRRKFEHAIRRHEMKGSQPPEDWDKIEENYQKSKLALANFVKQLKHPGA